MLLMESIRIGFGFRCNIQIVDDVYASEMQRLLGNALQEKDLEPPRSITEARSILSRDHTTNRMDSSSYIYF